MADPGGFEGFHFGPLFQQCSVSTEGETSSGGRNFGGKGVVGTVCILWNEVERFGSVQFQPSARAICFYDL